MTNRALCIGVNDYPYQGSRLKGCVNDAAAWAELLVTHYDFAKSDVKRLFDADATWANILDSLKDLVAGTSDGDVLVFASALHGTYIADTSNAEPMYDGALCPYDCDEHLLADDVMREFFWAVPKSACLTIISESCFAGTVTLVALADVVPGMEVLDDRRVRFLSPALLGMPVLENPWRAKLKTWDKYPESTMVETVLRASTDKEYCYEALIGGVYHGAMTYFALQSIRDAGYNITYEQLHAQLLSRLQDAGFPQHPQLEGRLKGDKQPIFRR